MDERPIRLDASHDLAESTINNKPQLSVIVPAYNEQETVGEILHRIQQTQLGRTGNIEIVAIDDGSTDDTWTRLQEWTSDPPDYADTSHDESRQGGCNQIGT